MLFSIVVLGVTTLFLGGSVPVYYGYMYYNNAPPVPIYIPAIHPFPAVNPPAPNTTVPTTTTAPTDNSTGPKPVSCFPDLIPGTVAHSDLSRRSFESVLLNRMFNISGQNDLASRTLFSRVLGGDVSEDGDWPFMAYIYERPTACRRICGGTLIKHQWVLTAAHCFTTRNASLYGVVLGQHTPGQTSGREMHRYVEKIFINDQHNDKTLNNDVALLKLKEPVEYTKYVNPANLVPSGIRTDETFSPSFAGRSCKVLGWGQTSNSGNLPESLMELSVSITPRIICKDATTLNSKNYGGRPVRHDEAKFCAGGVEENDSCDGDSGGPLVCQHGKEYYVHGITSYGTSPCGLKGQPGVYTKISNPNVSSWISETIADDLE